MNEGEKRIIKREVTMAQLNFVSGACIVAVASIVDLTNESWYVGLFVIFALIVGFISIVIGLNGYFEKHRTIKWIRKDLCSKE